MDEALGRAEVLLQELDGRRAELERLAEAGDIDGDIDGDTAVDVITEIAELARRIEAELTQARNLADAAG